MSNFFVICIIEKYILKTSVCAGIAMILKATLLGK